MHPVRFRVRPSENGMVSCSEVYLVQILRIRMSKQAAFSRVIWSAMVKPVKPGRRLANSTILIMHLVASSLNLSQRPRSSRTRWSALEFLSRSLAHAQPVRHDQVGGNAHPTQRLLRPPPGVPPPKEI